MLADHFGTKSGPNLPGWMQGQKLRSDEAASKFLRSIGIRGNRYQAGSTAWRILPPDQSRTGQWTVGDPVGQNFYFDTEAEARAFFNQHISHNYVIFDDADVKVKARFSIAPVDRVRTQSTDAKIVVVGDELGTGLSVPRAREAAEVVLRRLQHEARGQMINKVTGEAIDVMRAGRTKLKSIGADIRRSKLVPAIPLLIERGQPVNAWTKGKPGSKYDYWRTFSAEVEFAGILEPVTFLVGRDVNGRSYYLHRIGKEETAQAIAEATSEQALDLSDRLSVENSIDTTGNAVQQNPPPADDSGDKTRLSVGSGVGAGTGGAPQGQPASWAASTPETFQGRKLLKQLQADTKGRRIGPRQITDWMLQQMRTFQIVGKSQLTRKHPAHYKPSAHIIRTRSGVWHLNIHEAGHALSAILDDRNPNWRDGGGIEAALVALAQTPGSYASAETSEEGLAEFVRR